MEPLKREGVISKIGVSTNQIISNLDPRIDVLQIPFKNLKDQYNRTSCEIEVHSIVSGLSGRTEDIAKVVEEISCFPRVSKIVVATSSLAHFQEFRSLTNSGRS